jgi:hypothetical protein
MQGELDRLYCQLLTFGFVILRQASDSGDLNWIGSEVEFLHNVPSLIGESNAARHEYFWRQERTHYVNLVMASDRHGQKTALRTYYEPIWDEMEPVISAFCKWDS